MMGRWMSSLSELGIVNTQIEHRSGVKHINVDCLSGDQSGAVLVLTAMTVVCIMLS